MVRLPERMRQTGLRLREREVAAALGRVPDDSFDRALEIGAGDGSQSLLIARCAKEVVSTDLNGDLLPDIPSAKVRFQVCDCQDLPFDDGSFDLVYSSNVLEHVPAPQTALAEAHRVLRDDGIAVVIVPNRTWKLTQLALFYPHKLLTLFEVIGSRQRRRLVNQASGPGNNFAKKPPSFIGRNLFPTVHGASSNHLSELAQFGAAHWTHLFAQSGFDVAARIRGLPFHSPYRFGYDRARRAFERVGFSATNGWVLVKAGSKPDSLRYFL